MRSHTPLARANPGVVMPGLSSLPLINSPRDSPRPARPAPQEAVAALPSFVHQVSFASSAADEHRHPAIGGASAAGSLQSLLDGGSDAEALAAELSSRASDRTWLVAFGAALRDAVSSRSPASRRAARSTQGAAAEQHELQRAYTACSIERDRALADAEALRDRCAELKSSLEFVSTFERCVTYIHISIDGSIDRSIY